MRIYLKCFRSHVPLFRSITKGAKFGMSIRNVKLPALRSGASREGIIIHIVPLYPANKAGLAGHVPVNIIMMSLTGPVPDH